MKRHLKVIPINSANVTASSLIADAGNVSTTLVWDKKLHCVVEALELFALALVGVCVCVCGCVCGCVCVYVCWLEGRW